MIELNLNYKEKQKLISILHDSCYRLEQVIASYTRWVDSSTETNDYPKRHLAQLKGKLEFVNKTITALETAKVVRKKVTR